MRRGTLSQEEFTKRCEEVFDAQEGEEYYGIRIEDDGQTYIEMGETGTKEEGFAWVYFDYKPEMSGRSEALAYLMGDRDDFND